MKTKIFLASSKDVEEFVKAATMCQGDVDLKSGSIYIDGKSLLGVLSMGIKREMHLTATNVNDNFANVVKKFAVA